MRFIHLSDKLDNGAITNLILQPKFTLQSSFKDNNNKRHRAIHYIADFQYNQPGHEKAMVEDVKGYRTDVYQMKKKLFLFKFQHKYQFCEVYYKKGLFEIL